MSDKIWQFENEWYIKPDGHVFAICMNSEEAAKMLLDHEEAVEQSVHRTALSVRVLNAICYGTTLATFLWLLFGSR